MQVLGLDDQVDVRVGLVGVEDQGISVADPEFLSGECSGCGQHLIRWGRRRHREDDVVDQLGLACIRALVVGIAILAGGQFEMPAGEKCSLRVLAGDPLPVVGLDLELALPADVREMCDHGTGLRPAARDLDHHLRSPPHRPSDLLDLRRTELAPGRS